MANCCHCNITSGNVLSTNEERKAHADLIGQILHRRLAKHIRTKIDEPVKHNHPALLFVWANLNQFAAILVFFNQARMSSVLNMKSCLLQNPSLGGFVLAVNTELEGSYLHYHDNRERLICSGKAIGSNN